jgi:bifunctional DNA-binding transcriptional regulator/antitoxin component of YhaV-PrlF toxin-antitoxin module
MNRSFFSADGKIQLPESMIRQLDLQPQMPVHLFVEGNQVVIQPLNAVYFETLRGLLIGEGVSADTIREDKALELPFEERKLNHLFPSGL